MNLTRKKNNIRKAVISGFVGAAIVTAPVQAATFLVPSVVIGILTDDNVFIDADDPQSDIFIRFSPGLAAGYESERLQLGASYTQDAEWYRNNPELDSTEMRQFTTAELLYRLNELVILSVAADHTQSRIPAELNISSGAGQGRVAGERSNINPGLSYRVSERAIAMIDYTYTRDKLAGGTEGETNALNMEYQHELTLRTLMTYGYTYRHFTFDTPFADVVDQDETVHTPRVGITHNVSPNTTVSAQAGPSISSEGDYGANISILLQSRYASGLMAFGYDRSAASLIGEAGLVELNVINASIDHEFTNRLSLGLSASYSEVLRGDAQRVGRDIARATVSTNYRINDYVSAQANFSHSNQTLGTLIGEQSLYRNVAMLSLTFTYPRRSEPVVFVR